MDPESVADHSYRTALLAMLLADAKGLDTLGTVRMALLHDVAEAIVGDLTPRQKEEKTEWRREESEAFGEIIGKLPSEIAAGYLTIIDEYLLGSSPESMLVHAADKLEMLLQVHEYEACGVEASKLMRFRHVSVDGYIEKSIEREIRRRME